MLRLGYRYTRDQEKLIEWVNNGFIKVFDNIHNLRNKEGNSLGGWIRTIVYRSIIDGIRSEKKYWASMVFDEPVNGSASTLSLNGLEMDDLVKLIGRLDAKKGRVFSLYVLEGYSHTEIGEQLNISDGTSKWYLSKAREELREIINQSQEIY